MQEQTINLLPDYLANQIAAGEVVQRPESVVKELVENSLDSGADSIAVIVKGAGKTMIHIVDNGKGMSRKDLELAPLRHATSKIKSSEDLERIMSFGFRGEALASISAVASLEIRTKRPEDSHGWVLKSEPMKQFIIEPINCDNGTQVFVRNLFYNVPARKKFLKADLTEFRYISDTMIRLSISNFEKRFTFYDNDTMIFDVHPSGQDDRIKNVLGKSIEGGLLPIEFGDEKIKINGYIGLPHLAKPAANNQFLFINKRPIQSKSLSFSVFSAFEHLLEKNHKPLFAINLTVDPERVDVNIHPQKNEVKFEDDRYIYNSIHYAVSNTLSKHNLTPEHSLRPESPFSKMSITGDAGEENIIVNKITGEIISPGETNFNYRSGNFRQSENIFGSPRNTGENVSAFDVLFGGSQASLQTSEFHRIEKRIEISEEATFYQLHNKYIIMQTETGMLLIDQHNAHERIIYEKSIKMMNKELSNSQILLFPVVTSLSSSQTAVANEIIVEISDLGFDFTLSETGDLQINAVPQDISENEAGDAFVRIIEEYAELKKIRHSDKRDNLAAGFACKSAIKTGKKLSQVEMKSLAKQLMNCAMPYVCPHGRPVILEIGLGDLDKNFKRTS